MMILFLALIFGIIVAALLVFSIIRNRNAGKSKIVNILKLVILAEAVAYIVVFIIVIIKTMAALQSAAAKFFVSRMDSVSYMEGV